MSSALNQSSKKTSSFNVVFEFCKRDSFPHDVVFSLRDGNYKTVASIEKRRLILQGLNPDYLITLIISSNE